MTVIREVWEGLKFRIVAGTFLKAVAKLTGGAVAAQVLIIVSSPLLTRLYEPSDFGILAVYGSIFAMFVVVASWRYEMAIPLPEEDGVAASLLVLSCGIAFVMSMAACLAVWLFRERIGLWLQSPLLVPYLWFLPLSVLGAGLNQGLTYWVVRQKRFGQIARMKVTQSLGQVLTQVVCGLFSVGPLGLLAGDLAGRISGSGSLGTSVLKEDRAALFKVSLSGVRRAAVRYRSFPLWSSASGILNIAGVQLPAVIIALLYGPEPAGLFALSTRVIGAPMALVGVAVGQVFFSEASRMARVSHREIPGLFTSTAKRLMFLSAPPFILLAWVSPWLFGEVFGSTWWESGVYVEILALSFFGQMVAVPLSQILFVLERQNWQFVWDVIRLSTMLGVFFLASELVWPVRTALCVYGVAMFAAYVGLGTLSVLAVKQCQGQVG